MKKLSIAFLVLIFLSFSAGAYALNINFDPLGAGNFQLISAWGLESNAEFSDTPVGATGGLAQDWWSYEDAAGNFTESFTLQLTNMDLAAGVQENLFANEIYVDVTLAGNVDLPNQLATFTSGSATMYHDTDGNGNVAGADDNYGAGDILIATFQLLTPAFMPLTATVLDTGVAGEIDFIWRFTDTGDDFFGDTEDQLASVGWLMTFMGGRITVADIVANPTDFARIIGWDTSDIDTQFTAVPEPTMISLFGFGLLMMAGLSRKIRRE